MEKIVVRELIYPAIQIPNPHLDFSDQFAFRPTGSTTAAIITILQTITTLFLTNSYVLVYALDFSKAFDTVRHQTLLEKFALLDLPDKLYNWLVNYFDGRSHCTQFEDAISMLEEITASIIQRSSLGPAAYVVDASDLKTVHPENKIPKFADDTYLIVGSSQAATNVEELENVENWAKRNNLHRNHSNLRKWFSQTHDQKLKPLLLRSLRGYREWSLQRFLGSP